MNLVKWLRKNKTKAMAIVFISTLFAFIGGGTFLEYIGQRGTGLKSVEAYFADNRKITTGGLMEANRELEILRALQADVLLKSQDLRGVLLGELLFSEQRVSPMLIGRIKQAIRANQYRISDEQIGDMYRRSMPAFYYWYCLKNEANRAGIRVANEQAGRLLADVMPQLSGGFTYSQVMESLIKQQGIPERQILETFGKLLAVLQYAYIICANEDITSSQLMHMTSWEDETIDVEFVKFDSAVFADTVAEPDEGRMVEHFDRYKKFFAGAVGEENPYGFGYKIADRVQLEYIAVKLDDISSVVIPPTHQEKEEHYQRNIQQFKISVPSDPNDPNSPKTEQTQSYAEVAGIISESLLQDKINSRVELILQEARALTEAGLEGASLEPEKLTSEQFQKLAGSYHAAAEKLSEKHKVRVYTGQTGLLSATDIQKDELLGMLYLKSYRYNPVGLARIVFAIDELKTSKLGPFDMPKPRMYENIGPMKDLFGQVSALVRVVKAEPASEPESINKKFSTRTLVLDQGQQQGENIYSVKEKVAEDMKKLAAMDTTRSKARDFIELAAKKNWDVAIDKFNKLYGQKEDPNDPNEFSLQNFAGMRRLSSAILATFAVQDAGNPAERFLEDERKNQARFVDQLYSLVPQDSNTVDTAPLVMEFKPDMSFYIIKNISVERLDEERYEKTKVPRLYREGYVQTQSLAAVHFNPENILKRMNFRLAGRDKGPVDANAPSESEGAS